MTVRNNAERRPLALGAASAEKTIRAVTNAPESTPILPEPGDILEGVYVLVVAIAEPDRTRFRRRVLYSLDAAQKAADRAVMRGHRASVVLCRMAAVETVRGWEVAA